MEDPKQKKRLEEFMKIEIKDIVTSWEQFHVSLRKKRFNERANRKRGIFVKRSQSNQNRDTQNSVDYKCK